MKRVLWLMIFLGVLVPSAAASTPLYSYQDFGGPVHLPPLDSGVTWTRDTGSVLTLDSENHRQTGGINGLFVFSRATDAPGARSNDAVGVSVFQYANGSNQVWTSDYHGEIHAGQDWYNQIAPPNPQTGGTHIIYNGEASKWSPHATVIGMELNAVQQQTNPQTPMTPYAPDVGADIQGHWRTGIDLHGNSITHASSVDAATANVGSISIGSLSAQSANTQTVQAKRVYLAPRVWIDYKHGRICMHRNGRIVARF